MKNFCFLSQTEILSILGAVFVLNEYETHGWIMISLGVIGAFMKFTMNFHLETQKQEKRLLSESEKHIDEITKRLTENPTKRNLL